MSVIRQNYNEESEAAVNKHINMQLYASYLYQSNQHATCNSMQHATSTNQHATLCKLLVSVNGKIV